MTARPSEHSLYGPLDDVEEPHRYAVLQQDPWNLTVRVPQPHIDDALPAVVAVPIGPGAVGQQPGLQFNGNTEAIGHSEQDVSAAPVVGRTRFKNLWLNTGHGTLGWTMACGSGRLLTDLITGRQPEIAHEDLSGARYLKAA